MSPPAACGSALSDPDPASGEDGGAPADACCQPGGALFSPLAPPADAGRAVVEAFDGRGPATSLTAVARAEFGDLEGLYLVVQSDPDRVSRIAAWGRHVCDHAGSDPVSADISRRAGAALARSVAAGLRGVGADPVASRVGNVFRNPLILSTFVSELERLVPGIEVREPIGNGLLGASLLPGLTLGSPLAQVTDHYTVTA